MGGLVGGLVGTAMLSAGVPPPTGAHAAEVPSDLAVYRVTPSATDPAIARFDRPNYIVFRKGARPTAELVVFLPGTGGKPENAALLLGVVAGLGYRVIGLEYDDVPAVAQVCPKNPDPDCSAEFRRERIFGDAAAAPVTNSPAEAIVNRLVKLIQFLDRRHPDEAWGGYLLDGVPDWSRIVVSGLSQGAGMAAYIAKEKAVARVVLFSSPWDNFGPARRLAPWITGKSATPPERWFAEYHARENTAALIAKAYRALEIPPANIRVFDLGLPPDMTGKGRNDPFHASTIMNPGYGADWQFLFGRSP